MPDALKSASLFRAAWLLIGLLTAIAPTHTQLCAQPAPQPAPLVLHGVGRATAPLDGPWQFHVGDDLAWSVPTFDDSSWEQLQAGTPWEDQGHRGYTGFAWYRRHIVLTPGTPADLDFSLFLPNVDSACQVYWNGRIVGGIGKVPPHPVWFGENWPGAQSLVVGKSVLGIPLGPAQSGVLAIRVWKAPTVLFASPSEGGLSATPLIGSPAAVAALGNNVRYGWLRNELFSMAVVLLATLAALLALLMATRTRGNPMLIWLAVAMAYPLESFLLNEVPGLMPFRWSYGLVAPCIGLYQAALWLVLIALLGLSGRRRLVQWTMAMIVLQLGVDLVDGALQLFDWSSHPQRFLPFDTAFTIPPVTAELWGVVLVLFAFGRSLNAARWTLALCALAANLFQALEDLLDMGVRWTHIGIGHYLNAPLLIVAGCPLFPHTVASAALFIGILFAAWRYSAEQNQRQTRMDAEYRNAQQVQAVLIPEAIPEVPGFAIESVYKPAGEVGGDFFQVVASPHGGVLVVIGDVSGKGLPAAMTVSLLVGTFRTLAHYTQSPGEILAAMNQRMLGRNSGGFTTCLVLRISADGSLTLANAGHLSPYRNGQEVPIEPGLPLGLTEDADYSESTFALSAGDTFTLLSDGVVEAQSSTGELFGFVRTAAISTQSAGTIAAAAQQFGQQDDITVLTLQYAPAEVLHA